MILRMGITVPLLGAALGLIGLARVAAATPIEVLHGDLQRAVCLNDWEGAIALVNPMIAVPNLTNTYRQSLVDLRDQLTEFAKVGTVIPNIDQCESMLQRYVPAGAVANTPPEGAVAGIAFLDLEGASSPGSQADRQQEAVAVAGLERLDRYDVPALSAALFIDMQTGSAVSAGAVSGNAQIHTFFGGLSDRVTLDVDVTRILPGAIAQNDDTQLFLFDATGTLIAANNDDADGLQSKLEDILLPRTGRYYVAVTTYDNAPILDETDRILGWTLAGGSAVEYTLTIRGVTPSANLILTNYGSE